MNEFSCFQAGKLVGTGDSTHDCLSVKHEVKYFKFLSKIFQNLHVYKSSYLNMHVYLYKVFFITPVS